jgi:exopolyphosphatase/pppGpp-phosphohydrolase
METAIRVHGRVADRMAALDQWVVRRLGSTRHERRVMAIAARLFDLTAARHGLPPACRRLLRIGALLHDVGRCDGARRHHVRGAEMIEASRSLGLNAMEREAAVFLARFHRKRPPQRGVVREYSNLVRPSVLLKLLGLLRAADALDSRRLRAGGLTMRLAGRRLLVRCFVDGCRRQAERRLIKPDKFRLLERMLGIRMQVRIESYDEARVS